jgi:transcription termination factor NusA
MEIPGVGEMTVEILFMEGYRSAEEVAQASEEELLQIEGLDDEKATALIPAAKQLMEQKAEDEAASKGDTLTSLEGVGEKTMVLLNEHGIDSLQQLVSTSMEALIALPGIGAKKAEALLDAARRAITDPGETDPDSKEVIQ